MNALQCYDIGASLVFLYSVLIPNNNIKTQLLPNPLEIHTK